MSTYVIGDIHGCYYSLMHLLKKINFCINDDLIFVGDLVNRGKYSLQVLRFIKSLGDSAQVILGNHDIYIIAVVLDVLPESEKYHTSILSILKSSDKYDLIDWLCYQKIILVHSNSIIVHASMPHIWSLEQAKQYGAEVESILQSDYRIDLLSVLFNCYNMYQKWHVILAYYYHIKRIINYFTYMRVCDVYGNIYFNFKGEMKDIPQGFNAWFNFPNPRIDNRYNILFGHWAAINGNTYKNKYIALDTGCVWGNKLTAYCLTNKKFYSVRYMQ